MLVKVVSIMASRRQVRERVRARREAPGSVVDYFLAKNFPKF
jgi:hypothetical protein